MAKSKICVSFYCLLPNWHYSCKKECDQMFLYHSTFLPVVFNTTDRTQYFNIPMFSMSVPFATLSPSHIQHSRLTELPCVPKTLCCTLAVSRTSTLHFKLHGVNDFSLSDALASSNAVPLPQDSVPL